MWKDTTFNYAYFLWFEDTSVSRSDEAIFVWKRDNMLKKFVNIRI